MLSVIENFLKSKTLFIILLVIIVITLCSALIRIFFYEAFNYIEFEIVSFAMLIGRGFNPYHPVDTSMIPLGFYTPLTYLIPAILGGLFKTAGSPYHFLLTFRMAVFIYILGSLLLFYSILKRIGVHKNISLILTSAFIYPGWLSLSARPDYQALFYVLLALYLLIKNGFTAEKKYFIFVGILCAIATLHYQRYISLLFAGIVYFISCRKPRYSIIIFLSFLFASVLLMAPFLLITHGNIIAHSFALPFILTVLSPLKDSLVVFFGLDSPFFLLLAVMATYAYIANGLKSKIEIDAFLRIYALSCFLITIPTLCYKSAASNQLAELVLVCLLCLSLFFKDLGTNNFMRKTALSEVNYVMRVIFLVILLAFPILDLINESRFWRAEFLGRRGKYDYTNAYWPQLSKLKVGRILTDEPMISYKTGHPEASIESWYYTDILIPKKLFDKGAMQEKIRSKNYSFIVLKRGSDIYGVLGKEILENYRLDNCFSKYQVLVPR